MPDYYVRKYQLNAHSLHRATVIVYTPGPDGRATSYTQDSWYFKWWTDDHMVLEDHLESALEAYVERRAQCT